MFYELKLAIVIGVMMVILGLLIKGINKISNDLFGVFDDFLIFGGFMDLGIIAFVSVAVWITKMI